MALNSFPRGGRKTEIKRSSFLTCNETSKRKKKEKAVSKKADKNCIREEHNFFVTTAERLSNAILCEGMIILGRISEATEYELIVSLPGGLLGYVQVTDLGESYTNLLKNIVDSRNVPSSEFKSLPDLYNPGDYIVCFVKSINPEGKRLYNLSLDPHLINQYVDNSHLVKDARIVCTIKSIEDYGYIVDVGINNVTVFLASRNVDKEKQYFPGNQIFGVIKEIRTEGCTSVVTLSTKKKKVNNINPHNIEHLDVLMPRTKLSLCVTKVLFNGLQVEFGNNYIGYINQIYLNNPLSTYVDNTQVIGTLLYIMPTVKLAYFSLLTDNSKEEKLHIGDIIKEAKVLYKESNGIIFNLSKSGLRGFVSLRRTEIPFDKISTEMVQGSVHKCRILSYNWTEHLYVCSMENAILEQKYFSISDLVSGDNLTVNVTSINTISGFVNVQAGKIRGFVPPEHISDNGLSAIKNLKVGSSINARVLDVNIDKRSVKFTLKQSLIKSKLPVLNDIDKAEYEVNYHGTIVKMNKSGLLVQFYGDVRGWVPFTVSNNDTSDINYNYTVGQTITVCIDSLEKDKGRIKLRLITGREGEETATKLSIGQEVNGTIIESSVEGIRVRISKENTITGFLPADHMAPCGEIGSLLASKYIPGDTITALIFATQPNIILSRTFVTQQQYRKFDSLKIGDCIPCTIRDISQDGLRVVLPIENYSVFGFISYKNVSNFEKLRTNQILFVKITAINKRDKLLTLTMVLKEIWENTFERGSGITAAVDVLSLYLNKLSELSTFYKDRPISRVTLGQKVGGSVKQVTEHGLVLELDNNLMATVRNDHYSGNLQVGDKVSGVVLWKNHLHDLVDVSLIPRIVNGISSKQKVLPQLPVSFALKGEILTITNWLILVLIKHHGVGYLAALPVRRHVNDISPDLTPYVINAKVRLYVVVRAKETDSIPICMLKSAFETRKVKKSAVQSTGVDSDRAAEGTRKRKKTPTTITVVAERKGESDDKGKIGKDKKCNKVRAVTECKSDRKTELDEMKNANGIKGLEKNGETNSSGQNKMRREASPVVKSHIAECGFDWDSKEKGAIRDEVGSSSSEDEKEDIEEGPKRKRKKFSAAERREQERQKEREIREREETLASGQVPNSIDQFDRLVLSSPDSSLVWLRYMAHHLQATEIDKARSIARRAIKTINFREENERLNVWNAWLNLESSYGSADSLNDVFQEAVRANDAFKVYSHMLSLHADAGRQGEVEKFIDTTIGKFKWNAEAWVECGSALLKIGSKEKSRHVMQRALRSLPTSQHVHTMVRFANLENKYGDKERSQTLYEQILSSYPKRVDIWSSYVDSLIKSEDIDVARRVLERAVVQTLPARKMKTLFKKLMDFEGTHGTPEGVSRAQTLAAEYVERHCNIERL